MLIVTVDLAPGGFSPLRRSIASMQISNASDLAEISDYLIVATEARNQLAGTPRRGASCMLAAHRRAQSVWALVARASEEILKADFVEL